MKILSTKILVLRVQKIVHQLKKLGFPSAALRIVHKVRRRQCCPALDRDLIYTNDWLAYFELFICDVQSASYYMHVKHPAVYTAGANCLYQLFKISVVLSAMSLAVVFYERYASVCRIVTHLTVSTPSLS